ncbi:MAG: 3'-5' exonuclease [Bacteroidota bacterium]
MLETIPLDCILFLDIETVPQYPAYEQLPDNFRMLWDLKSHALIRNPELENPRNIYRRAGIYAEFGKVICISVGFIRASQPQEGRAGGAQGREFRVKSFYGDDEAKLLSEFADLLNSRYNKPEHLLCAHNGKEFDFPFLSRRMLINGIKLPRALNAHGKKPWEVQHLDTMDLWKFGDYKSYTSLNLLATSLNIPTPKDDIDGSKVYDVYWEEKNLDRIVTYCQKDVLTVAQIILRMRGEPIIEPGQVVVSN